MSTLDIPILGAPYGSGQEANSNCNGDQECPEFDRSIHFLFGSLTVIFFLIGMLYVKLAQNLSWVTLSKYS